MDDAKQQPEVDAEIRPLEDQELDQVAGGKRSQVQDSHDKYANTTQP